MTNTAVQRNDGELERMRAVAASGDDPPVLMLNLNRYAKAADYPHGELYLAYMRALEALLPRVGAKILWRTPVFGQIVGEQPLDEVLAVWYPSHEAFLGMPSVEGAKIGRAHV